MKPRRKKDLGSLDSLLDTMTSVVGILIIILVVLQLGAKQAVERIQSDPGKSPAIKKAMEEAEKNRNELERLQKIRITLASEREKLVAQTAGNPDDSRIKALEKELKSLQQKEQDKSSNPQMAKQLSTLRKENTQMASKIKAVTTEHKVMKDKLAKAPKLPAKPLFKNLKLPDPKVPKAGSKGYRIICTGGRVYPLDSSAWNKRIKDALVKSKLPKKGKNKNEYDGKAVVNYFGDNPLSGPLFTAKPYHDEKAKAVYFRLTARKTAGDAPGNLSKPQSILQKTLAKLDRNKYHILFTVFNDSFDAYLESRKVLDPKKFQAGWDPSAPREWAYQSHFNVYTIGYAEKPKPKPSKPKPGSDLSKAVLD